MKKKTRKSFLQLPGVQTILASLLCIVLGLLVGFVVLLLINHTVNPDTGTLYAWEAIVVIVKNFWKYNSEAAQLKYLGNTLVKTAPLLMCGLSVLFAYKVGLFNIGAAGQYVVGAGAALYLALPGLESFTAVPCAVDSGSYENETDALIAALAESDEPGLPKLFFGAGTILSSSTLGRMRVIDVSESFFASLGPDEREAAVKSLAATVLALGEARGVRITMNGEDAVFEGVSYAGPWTGEDINIVE